MSWKPSEIPDQTGRTALVTGVTRGGLGSHAARHLAEHGAHVVLAGRTAAKLDETEADIKAAVPSAVLTKLVVDLASFDSIRSAAGRAEDLGPIHVLLNNAGIMATPYRTTVDGLESQIATNHYGPFLLTGLLLPQLAASGSGRVVAVSSQGHRIPKKPPLQDPRVKGRYFRWEAYGGTKLANLLFTFELDRRLRKAGLPIESVASHPGLAGTHLFANGAVGRAAGGIATILGAAQRAVSQSSEQGSWPLLMAATDDLPGGTYVGPSGPGESRGAPVIVTPRALARNEDVARRLWELSEDVTGISYP